MMFWNWMNSLFGENKVGLEEVIKVLGLFGSVIAFLWSVGTGIRAYKQSVKDKRDKQLSDYISLFADENRVKRMSGVNGLVRYAKLAFDELFYICAIEQDSFIQGLLKDALENVCIKKKAECMKNNKFLVQYCLKKNIAPVKMHEFTDKEHLLDILRRGSTETRIEIEINNEKRSLLNNEATEIRNYTALSSQLLAKTLKKASGKQLKGILFVDSNLYEVSWKKCRLENAALLHNIGRHAKGKENTVGEVYLWDNDFYGSEFTEMECYKIYSYNTCFRNTIFRKLSIRGTKNQTEKKFSTSNIHQSVFEENIFNKSKFYSVNVEDCNMMKVEWKGCTLEDVSFSSMMFKENDWSGAKSVRCSFMYIGFYINKFHSEFLQCIFEAVNWGGSNLKGTKFKECTFRNVSFKGADLQNVLFENCIFDEDIDFKVARNSDKIQMIKPVYIPRTG